MNQLVCSGCNGLRTMHDVTEHQMCQDCRSTYGSLVIVAQTELHALLADDDPNGHLPERIEANRGGWPMLKREHYAYNPADPDGIVIRSKVRDAFLIAHRVVHPDAFIGDEGGIMCYTCRPEFRPPED